MQSFNQNLNSFPNWMILLYFFYFPFIPFLFLTEHLISEIVSSAKSFVRHLSTLQLKIKTTVIFKLNFLAKEGGGKFFYNINQLKMKGGNFDSVPPSPILKGVFAKNVKGFRLTANNNRFWSLLILLISVVSMRRKLFKTTYTEEHIAFIQFKLQSTTRIVK